jgi:hypothetical protein
MMPFPKSNAITVEKQDANAPFGTSWMPPLLPMPKNLESKVGEGSLTLNSFATIDDCKLLAEELFNLLANDNCKLLAEKLFNYLALLSSYKYPLGVRKGNVLKGKEVEFMTNSQESMMIKGVGRTYFFDRKRTQEGKPYLLITESRWKGRDGQPERSSLIIFPEDASKFVKTMLKMAPRLGQKD